MRGDLQLRLWRHIENAEVVEPSVLPALATTAAAPNAKRTCLLDINSSPLLGPDRPVHPNSATRPRHIWLHLCGEMRVRNRPLCGVPRHLTYCDYGEIRSQSHEHSRSQAGRAASPRSFGVRSVLPRGKGPAFPARPLRAKILTIWPPSAGAVAGVGTSPKVSLCPTARHPARVRHHPYDARERPSAYGSPRVPGDGRH